jgi:tRNA (cytidine/uridine-2'-O-)-methyltransferase
MNVVLYEPEIAWNTGNIGRTCVAAGAALHLVGRLGFRLDGKEMRRAGLDYWPKLKLVLHPDFAAFQASLPRGARVFAFSTKAKRSYWDASYPPESYLLFGRESGGLPDEAASLYKENLLRIPMGADVRSLNLSTSAALALYEALRQTGGLVTNP